MMHVVITVLFAWEPLSVAGSFHLLDLLEKQRWNERASGTESTRGRISLMSPISGFRAEKQTSAHWETLPFRPLVPPLAFRLRRKPRQGCFTDPGSDVD